VSGPRCSARPADLAAAARVLDALMPSLRHAVARFDVAIERLASRSAGVFAPLRWIDPLWPLPGRIDELARFTWRVGEAFAAAGGGYGAGGSAVVVAAAPSIDGWLAAASWRPGAHLVAGEAGAWARAVFGARCVSWGDAGYEGRGFLVGPDGRRYPLVAPHVVRDRVTYHADDGVRPGSPSVLDLDGRDGGWTTVYERTGVERWRDAPSALERVLAGVGSTALGPPIGSTAADVQAIVLVPGRAPRFAEAPAPPAGPPDVPSEYLPPAPEYPPPHAPGVQYPLGQSSLAAAGMNLAPLVVQGVAGAASADLGSYAAYDVALQQNADGRVRALYRRVFVGFDAGGEPVLSSVYVTGPERNDQVRIVYAPAG